jgi:hypothetical protein
MPAYTFHDVVQSLLDLSGGSSDDRALKVAKRAVQEAYRSMPHRRNWSYLYRHGRIITDESYNTGTIAFDYTGGSSELLLTLSGGTWPTNAAYGKVAIGSVVYDVNERLSGTTLTLKAPVAPTEDIAAGTSYVWFRDSYVLPSDFRSTDQMADLQQTVYPRSVTPGNWLDMYSALAVPSQPSIYCITGDPDNNGRMSVKFSPPPDAAYNFDYMYQRRPRPLKVYDYKDGTVSNTGTALTGSGTAFTQEMVGCVIRFYDASNYPTGYEGDYPYKDQAVIVSVSSATAAVLDVAPGTNYAAVKYRISDWIDLEDGAMYTAFLRLAEAEFAAMFPRDDASGRRSMAERAMLVAKESDVRHFNQSSDLRPFNRYKQTPGADDPAS